MRDLYRGNHLDGFVDVVADYSYTYIYGPPTADGGLRRTQIEAVAGDTTTYSYDATGNLTGYAYPNTVQTGHVFDQLNRLTQTCVAITSPACSAGTKLATLDELIGPASS